MANKAAELAHLVMYNGDETLRNQPGYYKDQLYKRRYKGLVVSLASRLKVINYETLEKIIREYRVTKIDSEFDAMVMKELGVQ